MKPMEDYTVIEEVLSSLKLGEAHMSEQGSFHNYISKRRLFSGLTAIADSLETPKRKGTRQERLSQLNI